MTRGVDKPVIRSQRLSDADRETSRSRRRPSVVAALLVPPDFIPDRALDIQTWAEAVFEPMMLIAATVTFIVGIVQFGLAFAPNWPAGFLTILCVVVSIESFVYSRRLTQSRSQFKEWLVLLAPAIVLERILTLLADPATTRPIDVRGWVTNPASFFTLGFIANTLILLLTWIIVFVSTQYLNQLRVQYGEIGNTIDDPHGSVSPTIDHGVKDGESSVTTARSWSLVTPKDRFEDNWRAFDHSAPLRQLGQIYVSGGVVLVILASLASIGSAQLFNLEALSQIIGLQRPSMHLVQVNVLAYFLCGLALIGECHFVRQRTLWRLDRVSMPTNVPGRWVSSLIGLIVVSTIIAFVLPTSYAMTVGDMVTAIAGFFAQVGVLIAAGLFYLAYLLAKLIPLGAGGKDTPAPSPPQVMPAIARPPADTSPFEILRSLVFWVVVLAIVSYSLYAAWRRRPAWLQYMTFDRLVGGLIRVLAGFARLLRRVSVEVARAVASVPQRFRQQHIAAPPPFRFVSLSRLNPRELIEYFYLSVCERAAQLGHPRPPGVTPDEFEVVLRDQLPVVEPEIALLTAAFVEARYGPRTTTKADVNQVRPLWQTLKQKLRRMRMSRFTRH